MLATCNPEILTIMKKMNVKHNAANIVIVASVSDAVHWMRTTGMEGKMIEE